MEKQNGCAMTIFVEQLLSWFIFRCMNYFKSYCLLGILCSTSFIKSSYAQQNSKFLYDKAMPDYALSIGLTGGFITRNTLFMHDFRNENFNIGYGLSLAKPLNNWLSFEGAIRWGGNLSGKKIDQNDNINYKIQRPLDFYTSAIITPFYIDNARINFSVGLGVVYFRTTISIINNTYIKQPTYETVVPISVSMKKPIWRKIDCGIGYQYYLSFVDNMDAFKIHDDFDKYSYTYIGIYYNIEKQKYGVRKNNRCPSVN